MNSNGKLQFLCDTLNKSGLQTAVTTLRTPIRLIADNALPGIYDFADGNRTVGEYLTPAEHRTFYKFTDSHQICYIYFRLPSDEPDQLLLIGPYVTSTLSLKKLFELSGDSRLPLRQRSVMEKMLSAIPIVPDGSPLLVMLGVFCEHLWGGAYAVHDIAKEQQMPATPLHQSGENESSGDILMRMQLMERRYAFENDLMQAITLGQINKVNLLLSTLSEFSFEKRAADPLRNMKNYCIIMNTLFRKAAEKGGVHPIYLDSVSTAFALKIEHVAGLSEIGDLMQDIFRSYCRLVIKHATREYSPLVQNTIVCIESDLSANLCLRSLAAAMKVSPGYLSTAFKRETGKTITEFIREKRIKHAMHLLSTTHLQIQTVALHCGIMDLQYFSKLFKRHTGMNPKEYRETHKR